MATPKINLSELKQYLKTCSQEELMADIAEFFKKFPSVKDYYQLKLYPQDEKEITVKYKKIIENEFFPARGLGKARLSVAKKAISEFKKVCLTEMSMINLMLFYVEQGVKFTLTYGDIDEPFYLSMEGMYEKAVGMIMNSSLEAIFAERCRKIVKDTSGMGWGFHDTLSAIYEENF